MERKTVFHWKFWEVLLYSTVVSYQANVESQLELLGHQQCLLKSQEQCSTQIRPDPTLRPRRRGCGEGGLDLTQVSTGSLRARAILIRQALVRASIVLALTLSLSPVYHWTSQWKAPWLGEGMEEAERGTGGGECWAPFIELQLKGLFQSGSVDQRKECLYCDWVMGWAREKNGQPVERAVCLSGLAWAPQTDHWAQSPLEQKTWRREGRADNLRSPVNS